MAPLIAYVDMNAYFASVEEQTNPALRGKPIAVGGRPGTRSIVTTASYEARRLGVKTAMSMHEAIARCPSLIIVPGNYQKYQDFTRRLALLAESFSPSVELCSIDELAIDIHHLVTNNLNQTAQNIAKFITAFKQSIATELGQCVTASIGIGPSSVLAKVAAELRKPNGAFFITASTSAARSAVIAGLPAQTWITVRSRLPLEAIPGIGKRLGASLRLAGYATLNHLGQAEEGELILRFGILGSWLWRVANGRPTKTIHAFQAQSVEQSMTHQITLPRDLPLNRTRAVFFSLADRIGNRLNRAQSVGHTVIVGFGQTNAPGWYRHVRTGAPITNGLELFQRGWQQIQTIWGERQPLVRRPTIGVTSITPRGQYPPSLFTEDRQRTRMHDTVYALRTTYGNSIIQPATALTVQLDHIPDGRRVGFHMLAREG